MSESFKCITIVKSNIYKEDFRWTFSSVNFTVFYLMKQKHLKIISSYDTLFIFSGVDAIGPKELESMKHQLEEAQRWNASLQARLGAIQNRGGGVGGAKDSGKKKNDMSILIQD